ncbi:MAG: tRNA (adenosine(37)-N6)-threonylcarbamoyltransferase complex ATPase subunit type 1 TsaE [Ruminococcus sp.]|jgi:tRNA threonylcarbamoyladenosine biosynthesis protein TsaE|nr:tRNA (adenosine(37)-N6)-threonylcarbamoyltransferase complex ATPase subunit type 1 TsaE [Ruminococcus sp.]
MLKSYKTAGGTAEEITDSAQTARTVKTSSVAETEQAGVDFAKLLRPGDTVAFFGGLGAGKTAFIRGLAKNFSFTETSSPTFTIVNEYINENIKIYHFDMYRIKSESDLESIGFYDYTDGIKLIEWYENIADFGVEITYTVSIEITGETERLITIEEK